MPIYRIKIKNKDNRSTGWLTVWADTKDQADQVALAQAKKLLETDNIELA